MVIVEQFGDRVLDFADHVSRCDWKIDPSTAKLRVDPRRTWECKTLSAYCSFRDRLWLMAVPAFAVETLGREPRRIRRPTNAMAFCSIRVSDLSNGRRHG